ncbi:hypothetical protein [Nocardiopsis dassonvillei]|uniref:hypothetical protein n=1 Tax=Nocardiopsis dassonvillei TaxID=2014 RepID=UPI003643379C
MKRVPAAAALLLPIALTACGTADSAATSDTESAPSEHTITLEIVTDDGAIGQNHDDSYCVWRDPAFVLRDGSGEIIATGDIDSGVPGEAEAGGEPAQLGEVRSTDPYECVMPATITAEASDFYELEVTVTEIADVTFGENASADLEQTAATVTFSQEDAKASTPIVVEL